MSVDEKPLAVHFGENLRIHRHRARFSQEDLGFRASLHRTEISLLERGLREPRLNTILKLSGALSVTLDVLLVGVEVGLPNERAEQ